MNSILKRLHKLPDHELFALSEAIDTELNRRSQFTAEEVPDSARRRAVEREQGYKRRTGSFAPPVRVAGLGKRKAA